MKKFLSNMVAALKEEKFLVNMYTDGVEYSDPSTQPIHTPAVFWSVSPLLIDDSNATYYAPRLECTLHFFFDQPLSNEDAIENHSRALETCGIICQKTNAILLSVNFDYYPSEMQTITANIAVTVKMSKHKSTKKIVLPC